MQPQNPSEILEENKYLKNEVVRLKEIIELFRRDKFGSKSEKIEVNPEQLTFNEIEVLASSEPPVFELEKITYLRKKGRKSKKPFPSNIEREEEVLDLPENEKFCPHDGSPLKEIGEDLSEKMKTYPARMVAVTVKTKKYACPDCSSHMVQAKSNSILPKTIATPETLSFIIFSKFFQSLPLYRLEELYKLNGIELKRGTMARWLIKVSEQLMPIWNILEEKVLQSEYVNIDATHVQVLKEKSRTPQSKSFMWVRGSPEKGIVLFDYDVSGGGAVAKKLMIDFKGALQADAHRGYGALDRKLIYLLGCMMHARRRFYDAWIASKKTSKIAHDALLMFKWIYDKEEQYKEKGLTPAERFTKRAQEVGPSLDEIKKWCHWQLPKVAPSSLTANALNYFINEFEELSAFLRDGRYEIDNGWVERVIRRFAIGRKNWMFSDTTDGAHASALLYSLTCTAKLNGKDPFLVMTEIFQKLPMAKTIEDYEALTEILLSPVNPNSCRKKEGALIH